MYDPELPRGFQDADFEMRDLEEAARDRQARLKMGLCDHLGSGQTRNKVNTDEPKLWTSEAPADAPIGSYWCFDCNTLLPPGAK